MQRLSGITAAALGLLALCLALWWLRREEEPQADEGGGMSFVLPVTLADVVRGELQPQVTLSGSVRSARRALLGFDAEGIVGSLRVREAARVTEGESLALLDRRDEELELKASNASLALANRELELLLAGEREEEKRRLYAELEAARAEAELARLEVERGEKLLSDRVVSQSEQDRRTTEFRAADQRRVAAEERHARAIAGSREEDIAIARARVEQAEARRDAAEHALAKTELSAPWEGAIVERYVSPGDFVSAGDPVFELVDLVDLEVHVEIPGRYAGRISSGTPVVVRAGERRIEARLSATIPAADELARSFRGIVRLEELGSDELDGGLVPGQFADVEILLQSVRDALLVPSDTVLVGEDGFHVFRATAAAGESGGEGRGLTAELVPVRVLAEVSGTSAVEPVGAPLAPGDRLVLVGAGNAFPGAPLLPREEEGEAAAPEGSAAPAHRGPEDADATEGSR